jgi:hypothetical protein
MRTIFQCNEVLTSEFAEMEREWAQHKNDEEPNYRTCTCKRFCCCFLRISARDSCGVLISIIVVLQYFIISFYELQKSYCLHIYCART